MGIFLLCCNCLSEGLSLLSYSLFMVCLHFHGSLLLSLYLHLGDPLMAHKALNQSFAHILHATFRDFQYLCALIQDMQKWALSL